VPFGLGRCKLLLKRQCSIFPSFLSIESIDMSYFLYCIQDSQVGFGNHLSLLAFFHLPVTYFSERARGLPTHYRRCLVQYISYQVEILVCAATAEKDDYISD
jgi:hypothetical protein